MNIELEFVESSQIFKIKYEMFAEALHVTFRNGDQWVYSGVPDDVVLAWTRAQSAGSFFHERVKPGREARQIHVGTIDDRARIWLRSKDAKEFEGSWVMLSGNPVKVVAWDYQEEVLRSLASDGAVVVEVPK